MIAWLAMLLSAAPLFDVQTIPIDVTHAVPFIAAADNDGTADLFVLDRQRLSVFENAADARPRSIALPEGCAALDIADLDADGRSEAIAIQGDRVLRLDIGLDAKSEAVELFRCKTQFSAAAATPRLNVLAIERGGKKLLALPCEEALELRRADGSLVESFPIGANAPHRASFGQPLRVGFSEVPAIAAADALEFRVNRFLSFEPQLPPDLMPKRAPELQQYAAPRQARGAATAQPADWPWFALQANAPAGRRAAYAIDDRAAPYTIVCVRDSTDLSGAGEMRFGPERRYPGVIVALPERLPDFDGDGFTDLLLWHAPRMAPTLGTLGNLGVRNAWPITLVAHRFDPAAGRFAAVSFGSIEVKIPAAWLLSDLHGMPLHCLSLRDFDGDGRTDIGCALGETVFAAWRATPEGFGAAPDFTPDFPEELLEVVFEAPLESQRRTTIGLRGKQALYVLKPTATESPLRLLDSTR